MDNLREKLTELVNDVLSYLPWGQISSHTAEEVADHLLANGVTVQRWIPVTERLPDLELVEVKAEDMDLFPCLVVKSSPQALKKRFVTKAWYDGEGFMDTDCIGITKAVTHWMPLPELPKED